MGAADRCGNKTLYEYDVRICTSKVISKNDEDAEFVNVSYTYDAFDNLTEIVRGDGLKKETELPNPRIRNRTCRAQVSPKEKGSPEVQTNDPESVKQAFQHLDECMEDVSLDTNLDGCALVPIW